MAGTAARHYSERPTYGWSVQCLSMKRRLFNILVAFSLLLFVVTVGLWLRSYWTTDHILLPKPGMYQRWSIQSYLGRLGCSTLKMDRPIPDPSYWYTRNVDDEDQYDLIRGAGEFKWTGFGNYRQTIAGGKTLYYEQFYYVPYWFPVLLSAILPWIWIVKIRNWRQHRRGMCRKCGYDLRASKDRCPECGASVSVSTGESHETS